jgi:hypothetical protein
LELEPWYSRCAVLFLYCVSRNCLNAIYCTLDCFHIFHTGICGMHVYVHSRGLFSIFMIFANAKLVPENRPSCYWNFAIHNNRTITLLLDGSHYIHTVVIGVMTPCSWSTRLYCSIAQNATVWLPRLHEKLKFYIINL